MLNIQPKAAAFVANIAAVAALSLGFVATGTLSASAESKPTVVGTGKHLTGCA